MSTSLATLRQILEQRFPDAVPPAYRTVPQVATGIAELDRILPGGGLARGRLAAWIPGGAATAVLAGACRRIAARGERVAWVDGAGTVSAPGWISGPYLVRPRGEGQVLGCTEELLRSGGFALVVLAGARLADTPSVRLARAAREGGGAFVALCRGVPTAHLRLRSRVRPDDFRWRLDPWGMPAQVEAVSVQVRARSLGWSADARLQLAVRHHDPALSLEPGLADRRGTRP